MSGIVTIVVEPAGPWLLEEGLQHILDHFKVLGAAAQFLEEGTKIQWGLGAAHMNSPLSMEAHALNAPQLAPRAVGEYARAAHAPRPPAWIRSCPAYRNVLTSKGMRSTQISCPGAEPLVFSQDFAARALQNLDALCPKNLAHIAYGVREGYISSVGTYYKNPSFNLKDILDKRDITCIVKDQSLADRLGKNHSWREAWEDRRVVVHGLIFYKPDGKIKEIEVQNLEEVHAREVPIEKIFVKDFTRSMSVPEYIDNVRDGHID